MGSNRYQLAYAIGLHVLALAACDEFTALHHQVVVGQLLREVVVLLHQQCQLGCFHKFSGKDYEDKRPRDRYVVESKRLLGVLEVFVTLAPASAQHLEVNKPPLDVGPDQLDLNLVAHPQRVMP